MAAYLPMPHPKYSEKAIEEIVTAQSKDPQPSKTVDKSIQTDGVQESMQIIEIPI
jgi:hypothetical protein